MVDIFYTQKEKGRPRIIWCINSKIFVTTLIILKRLKKYLHLYKNTVIYVNKSTKTTNILLINTPKRFLIS